MSEYVCGHCGKKVKNNGGSAREVGMIEMHCVGMKREKASRYYCYECAKEIAEEILSEI
jgi:hypothetical protein